MSSPDERTPARGACGGSELLVGRASWRVESVGCLPGTTSWGAVVHRPDRHQASSCPVPLRVFERIPLFPQAQRSYLDRELDQLRGQLTSSRAAGV
jgi:hypothetical protein